MDQFLNGTLGDFNVESEKSVTILWSASEEVEATIAEIRTLFIQTIIHVTRNGAFNNNKKMKISFSNIMNQKLDDALANFLNCKNQIGCLANMAAEVQSKRAHGAYIDRYEMNFEPAQKIVTKCLENMTAIINFLYQCQELSDTFGDLFDIHKVIQ